MKGFFYIFLCSLCSLFGYPGKWEMIAGSMEKDPNILYQYNVTTEKAIVKWKNFTINPGESCKFVQMSPTSLLVNLIEGMKSQVLGDLYANGRVYLINYNGVLIGNQAKIDVAGGFFVSKLDMVTPIVMEKIPLDKIKNQDVVGYVDLKTESGNFCIFGKKTHPLYALHSENNIEPNQEEILIHKEGEEQIFIRAKLFDCKDGPLQNLAKIQNLCNQIKKSYSPYTYAINLSENQTHFALQEEKGHHFLVNIQNGSQDNLIKEALCRK